MKLSTNVNLNKEPFHLNYEKTSNQRNWEMFHAHQSMEFLYIYEGEGMAHIHGKQFPIVPGTLLIFQPFQLHRLEIKQLYVRTVFMFDPFPVDTALIAFPGLRKFFNALWKSDLLNQAIYLPPQNNVFLTLYKMLNERLKNVPTNKWQEEFILFVVSFLQHFRQFEKELLSKNEHPRHPKTSHTIEQVIRWVDLNFRDKFMLERLSEELHLSTYYLSHTFSQKTGSSLTEFINGRRLREACLLLETTSRSVSQIAGEVGFQNASYFCRVFKQAFGVTPKKYRVEM